MTLPEIPDEALDAAAPFGGDVLAAVAAAWPHLYAAALRHAADSLSGSMSPSSVDDLRDMADEATRRHRLSRNERR